jgi:hypothetical protein
MGKNEAAQPLLSENARSNRAMSNLSKAREQFSVAFSARC